MVLLVADEGPLRAAIVNELESAGVGVRTASADDEDLWSKALRQQAIIYLPEASLLDGLRAPRPDEARLRAVLGAAEAPGVTVVVPVFPATDAYAGELAVLKRHGKPYAALRAHPLVEEIASLVPAGARALYLPRVGRALTCRAADVARAVRLAIDTEEQGRITDVPPEPADVAGLVRRAAATRRAPVRVRGLAAWLFRLARPLFRWARRAETHLLGALADLFPELSEHRALPPPAKPGLTAPS